MRYTILDPQSKPHAHLEAATVEEACRQFGRTCWKDEMVEKAVLKAPIYVLGGGSRAAFLDPYLVAPTGCEEAARAAHRRHLDGDPHFAPDPVFSTVPRTVDTGGGD